MYMFYVQIVIPMLGHIGGVCKDVDHVSKQDWVWRVKVLAEDPASSRTWLRGFALGWLCSGLDASGAC